MLFFFPIRKRQFEWFSHLQHELMDPVVGVAHDKPFDQFSSKNKPINKPFRVHSLHLTFLLLSRIYLLKKIRAIWFLYHMSPVFCILLRTTLFHSSETF